MFPITIVIPQFIRKVKLSDKQRGLYYHWDGSSIKGKGKTIPRGFFTNKFNIPLNVRIEDLKTHFVLGAFKAGKMVATYRDSSLLPTFHELRDAEVEYRLCSKVADTYEPILLNPKKVNKPRMYLIKGQDIYSGNLREHMRGTVMDAIKLNYLPHVKDMPVITEYPVKIELELHDTIKNAYDKSKGLGQRWDIDNLVYPYIKAFPDLLVSLQKLKDDDRLHVSSSIGAKFVPIAHHDNRKLVFIITKDERPEILENEVFSAYHKDPNTYETEDRHLSGDRDFIPINPNDKPF